MHRLVWSGIGRLCCKSLKTPGDKFPARSRNKPRSLIDVASGSLPKVASEFITWRCGPPPCLPASAARKICDRRCKKTFTTQSANNGHSGCVLSSAPTMVLARAARIRPWHPKLEVRAEHASGTLGSKGGRAQIDNPVPQSPNELARYVTAFLPARLHAHTHLRRTLCSRNFCDSQPSKAWLGADMAIPTYHSCCSLRGREFV